MGSYWAINLFVFTLKALSVIFAIGSVWVFIELQRVAGEGIRQLSFIGIEIGTDASTAIYLAPFIILLRGLLASLVLYASAQFLKLLTDLMIHALAKMRGREPDYRNYVPPMPENEVYLQRPNLNQPPARQDERATAVRAGGKWDMGKS